MLNIVIIWKKVVIFPQTLGSILTLPLTTCIIIDPNTMTLLKASRAGIFISKVRCGTHVDKGEKLGKIIDALSGQRREDIISPCEGIVTCQYSHPLIFQNSIAFRIASVEVCGLLS